MFFGGNFSRGKNAESVAYGARRMNADLFDLKHEIPLKKHAVAILALSFLALLITMICFGGQDLLWIQFIPRFKARVQITAQIPFEYVSEIKTERLREQRRSLVAPVFKIDLDAYDHFENGIFRLDELLDGFADQTESLEAYFFELKAFVRSFNDKHALDFHWSDIDTLVRNIDAYGRTGVLVEGLAIVKDILKEGIFDQSLWQEGKENFLNIEVHGGDHHGRYRDQGEADRFFKLRFFSVEIPADVLQAVYRVLKNGLKPNIVFDDIATSQKMTKVVQSTPSVIQKVLIDDVIIEGGSMVTPEHYESLLAYRNALEEANIASIHGNGHFGERYLCAFLVLALIYLFFCTTRKDLRNLTRKEMLLAIVLLLINLLVCRAFVWVFEWKIFAKAMTFAQGEGDGTVTAVLDPLCVLPYLMPMTFSCLLGTLLLRTYVGVMLGVMTAIFCNMMLAQPIELLVMMLIVILVSVYFVRHSYVRTQVIRSGYVGGLLEGVMAIIFAIGHFIPREMVIIQLCLGFGNCLLVSMIVLTILPFFEDTFKCCTNICLIELTDYRSPLLMKLQILAPGTYQHSLMVANLAEQAAISIQANPFLCRTLAMYHDVGKLIKPEYFMENQSRQNKNPHDEKTPFMSALILKSHVKEGAMLARTAGIPPRIIDGITEHHGTTMIRYFYSKALRQRNEEGERLSVDASVVDLSEIERSVFKYDGPRPRSRETLILSIADSVEAASRSLYNPTPQSIGVLIDGIIEGKIKENQFDECRITFQELSYLRQSFFVTLLNMLHSRINYDEVKV
ncbi:MAG: HDIG domain-containing protein [Puniceicoccales bacterium]|jgi:putative nucleotidyltransferase with HDIG domain|nr:HDIG domain-containing protein [Puniceicoccales bacterium]